MLCYIPEPHLLLPEVKIVEATRSICHQPRIHVHPTSCGMRVSVWEREWYSILHVVMRVLRAIQKHCCAHSRNRNWNWYYNMTEKSNYVSAWSRHQTYAYTCSTTTPHA